MLADGIESPANLAKLITHWPQIVARLPNDAAEVPVPALNHLVGIAEDWLRVAGGHASGRASVSDEQQEQARAGVWTILQTLAPVIAGHQGMVLKTWNLLDLASRWNMRPPVDFEFPSPDPDLSVFVARRLDYQSTDEWMAEQAQLARRLSALGPGPGTARFVELVQLADEADLRADGQFLALELAKAVEDPRAWVADAVASESYSLTYRMIWEVRKAGLPIVLDDLERGLSNPQTRGAVIGATLEGQELDEPAQYVLRNLGETDGESLERLFARESADEVLLSLLEHPAVGVRVAAALAFSIDEGSLGPSVPDSHSAPWTKAFQDASLAQVRGHNRYRLREILEHLIVHDPELCAQWFAERMREEAKLTGWRVDRLDDFENLIPLLPRQQRDYLVNISYPDEAIRWRYLPELIGADPELADQLLAENRITPEDAISGLSGERDAGAKLLAPVLLRHGIVPERVAGKISGGRSFMGDESAAVMADIRWFEDLQAEQPELTEVSMIALDALNSELARVLEEEKVESVRGWS